MTETDIMKYTKDELLTILDGLESIKRGSVLHNLGICDNLALNTDFWIDIDPFLDAGFETWEQWSGCFYFLSLRLELMRFGIVNDLLVTMRLH